MKNYEPFKRPVIFVFGTDDMELMRYGINDADGRRIAECSDPSDGLLMVAFINDSPEHCPTCGSTDPSKRAKIGGEMRSNKHWSKMTYADVPDCDNDHFHNATGEAKS